MSERACNRCANFMEDSYCKECDHWYGGKHGCGMGEDTDEANSADDCPYYSKQDHRNDSSQEALELVNETLKKLLKAEYQRGFEDGENAKGANGNGNN